jgi:hypothetical protein
MREMIMRVRSKKALMEKRAGPTRRGIDLETLVLMRMRNWLLRMRYH